MPDFLDPILTDSYDNASKFRLPKGATYIFGKSGEDRCEHSAQWRPLPDSPNSIELIDSNLNTAFFRKANQSLTVRLRSDQQLRLLWDSVALQDVFIDITGLPHHVWAPVLKSALLLRHNVRVIYVEPERYKRSETPTEGQIYDLSERILGLEPIPGLASITSHDKDSVFVPLLGFEGTRFAYVLEQVQPSAERIHPVIGVPGFRLEYYVETYLGNRRVLLDTGAWERVEYVSASCPFSLYTVLEKLSTMYSGKNISVALIGTKPHALGAILYKLLGNPHVELLYDHPLRKPQRTAGADKLHVYHVSALSSVAPVSAASP